MPTLTWFEFEGYKVGIDTTFDPQAIADCLSAGMSIPLGTRAEFIDSGMMVHTYRFDQIPQPLYPSRFDQIFFDAGAPQYQSSREAIA